jgi:hypothetical protein
MEEFLKDLEACKPPRITPVKAPREAQFERRAKSCLVAAILLALGSVAVALWHIVHPVPVFVRTLALLVLGSAPVLLLICIALEVIAQVVGVRFRMQSGEPVRVDSLRLEARAEQAHVERLARYPVALLQRAQHYLQGPGVPDGDTAPIYLQAIGAIATVAGSLAAVGLLNRVIIDGWLAQLVPFRVLLAAVLISVFVVICAFVASQWLTRRRRRYHLWLIGLVLLTKASSPAPIRRLNRRMGKRRSL